MKKPMAWVIIVIILFAGYRVVTGLLTLKNEQSLSSPNWTIEDKKLLTNQCIKDSGQMAKKYPDITAKYCDCTTLSITENISKKAYLQNLKKSTKEQVDFLGEFIMECYDRYMRDIDDSNEIIN